jgi:hypothetical protein
MSRPLDHFDEGDEPQYHRPQTPLPLGYDACCKCSRLSELYRMFPSCRTCADSFCPDCYHSSTLEEHDGTETVICGTCADEAEAERVARICDSCHTEDVPTREVVVGDGWSEPRFSERQCQRCAGRRWWTSEELEHAYERSIGEG